MSDEKTCPRCAETVKAAANVCKHCGYDFQTGLGPDTHVIPPPPKSGSQVGKGCAIVAGVLVVLFIIGAIAGGGEQGAGNGTESTPAADIEPIEVTARQLEAAYEANEAAAQQQYGGVPLLVTATIRSIDLDFSDEPRLMLAGSNPYMGPQADLTDASQAKASGLSKGQSVTLLCQGVGEVIGTPMLRDCEIQ